MKPRDAAPMLDVMANAGDRSSLESRVAVLEQEVRQLRAELDRTRASGRRPDASAEASAPPASGARLETWSPTPRPAATPRLDLETLVGRYGMLGLATLLALAAIGTFVSWAIARGLLGPTTRVILGLAAAAAIAAAGLKLRPRSRSYGDSLLALALAAVHVCAWAAGPSLQLVPPFVALACSAVVSVALGAFALVEADEPLWCVGFGGASVAPFVTSTGSGTAPMLAAYAAAVLVAGGSGLGSRRWSIASRVFTAGAALFVLALLGMPAAQNAPLFAMGLPLAVAGFAVLPFAGGEVLRPRMRTLGLLTGLAGLRLAFAPLWWMRPIGAAIAVGIAGCLWLALMELTEGQPAGKLLDGLGDGNAVRAAWLEGAAVPGLFVAALAVALHLNAAPALGAAAAILVAFASQRTEEVRDALAATAWAAAMLAIGFATRNAPEATAALLAWTGIAFLWMGQSVPTRTWKWTSRISLVLGSIWAAALFASLPHYGSLPFTTGESAAAFAVALAWAAALYEARADAQSPSQISARLGLLGFAFAWGHLELDHAFSPSASSLLLIGYYASAGVALVGWGRARHSARLRRLGLGLGLIAAFLAARSAWHVPAVGTRIAAYLLVSGFLLGIAWWYRQPDEEAAAPLAEAAD